MMVPRGGMGGVGIGAGGFRGGAIAGRPGGFPGRVAGVGPGFRPVNGGFRQVAIGNRGDLRYGGRYYGGRYPYYGGRYPYYGGRYPYGRYYGGYYPYYGSSYPYYGGWGWGAAGLATGAAIGAVASTYPVYQTQASSAVGGYCATAIRTCALNNEAPTGTGCSCRAQGGRARGTVVGY
jgi:hypothetical protein